LLKEKRFLLVAATGLFVIFSLLAGSLFYTIIASAGTGERTTGEAAATTPDQLPPLPPITPPPEGPPNILLILSDDQPFYTDKYTPAILNEIFAKGTKFSDAFLSIAYAVPAEHLFLLVFMLIIMEY
jgi:hypothetical protein